MEVSGWKEIMNTLCKGLFFSDLQNRDLENLLCCNNIYSVLCCGKSTSMVGSEKNSRRVRQ